jgi:serine/threonine-protein kinase
VDADVWRRVEELSHYALNLPSEERVAFLAQACAGDTQLLREIESLLAHEGQSPAWDQVTLPAILRGSVAIGQAISHYRITAKLGEGGMGAVYQATDTKLAREVAIKVLPNILAQDPKRLARFEREAKILASLNHPNIAQIYGVEDRALVMELVGGETLKGPLPVETALHLARQIADALEAAHEKGIVHRDLKPANIMVTPQGVAKVLDFGLAAVMQPSVESAGDPRNSSTLTMGATQAGMIIGTAAYMSPEQAAGKTVDRRADIWSFGVVLFEMLTGKRLFDNGETISHILADVMRAPIDFARLPAETPAVIRELLGRCLDRDLRNRLRDIGEARVVVGKYLADPASGAQTSPPAASPHLGKTPWVAGIAAMTLVACVAGFGWWRATRAVERPLVKLDVDLGPDVSLDSPYGPNAIVSPDGGRLVFVSKTRLFTRRLNHPEATELAGTEGAIAPFFSPDGQWIAFFGGGKLKKISVEGGAAIALCDAADGRGGAWGEAHNIIAALSQGSVLSRISDAGGVPQPLTELLNGEANHRWPQILPGDKAVLFTATATLGGYDDANIEVMSLKDRRRKTLLRGCTYGRYLPTANAAGHLVYINKGTLFAVPFDPDTLEVRGTPVPVLHKVSYSSNNGSAQFDCSQAGTLVYRSRQAGEMVSLQWFNGGGKSQPLPAKPGSYIESHLSPDGKLVALSIVAGSGSDIWTYDWQRDAMSRLTFGDGAYNSPVWSPDGRYLAFHADSGIVWIRADGAGKPQPLTQTKTGQWPSSFSPDGKRLAFAESGSGVFDLWTVPVENESGVLRAGKPEVFLQSPFPKMHPAFSRDGRWIAYMSGESGTSEVYVRAFPDNGRKWQISNGKGDFGIWSPNGRELFYLAHDRQIMVVGYTTKGDSFVPDRPRLWSEERFAAIGFFRNLDISPDGKRFVGLMPFEAAGEQRANRQVIFMQNFFDELRRRVPDGK